MGKFLKSTFDWIVIFAGCVLLILSLRGIEDNCLKWGIYIAAGLAVVYAGYAFILFFFKRPQFDWHLINGHFLLKTCCLILLMPFLLTVLSGRFFVDSPKELVYESNLYECKDNKLPCKIKHKQESPNLFWSTYYHFVDPGNQHMTTSQSGREWAALIAILGVFLLNGLLVSSIVGWIDSRKEKWIKGAVRYKWFLKLRDHYVIIGGNDVVVGIVKQLFEQAKTARTLLHPYILIQTSRDVESFRRELFSSLTERQQQHIIIYYGSRISEIDIKDLCVGSAKEVYVLGEDTRTDDIESYHDTMNMKCLDLVCEQYKNSSKGKKITAMLPRVQEYRNELKKCKNQNDTDELRQKNEKLDAAWKDRPRLNCRVMFEYQTTFSVFQFFDLNEQMDSYVDFIPFNYYEICAQNVLINKCIEKKQLTENFRKGGYLPLEGSDGIKANDEKYVHLFVVGMSRMGVAMAIEAAHLAHYPNYEEKKIRTKITFIDKNAAEEKDFFMGRFKELFRLSHWRYGEVDGKSIKWIEKQHFKLAEYAYLGGDFLDIEWEFVNGGIESSAIQNYILASANPMAKVTIAICLPESNRSHAAALFLDKRIYESNSVLQVLAYNRYGSSIVDAISKGVSEYPFCGKLRSFGCAEDCVVHEHLALSEEIGRYIEDVYAEGRPRYAINPESLYTGKSHTANRWSSIYNGNTMWTKLRCINFNAGLFADNQNDINLLANVEHNRWNVEELLMNFRYLEAKEQIEVIKGEKKKKELKKKMAHLDICSNHRLMQVDRGVRKYDVLLTKCLRDIYEKIAINSKKI